MTYLVWYLGIGIVVLLIVYVSNRISTKSKPDFSNILESLDPERETWRYKILIKVVVPILAAIAIPLIWPIAVYWKIKDFISKDEPIPPPEKVEFTVTKDDLRTMLSIETIEQLETVTDPMCSVPNVAFGFLNLGWEAFKAKIQPGDQLWAFEAQWEADYVHQRRYGYAILRTNAIPHHFLSKYVPIERPPEPDPTFDELEQRLTDRNWEIRWGAVYNNNYKLTAEQIERGQQDKERMVRHAFARRNDLVLTPRHIEIGLTDKNDDIREIYACRGDIALTPAQIERGLNDPCSSVRMRIVSRRDVANTLTQSQIERKR